MNLKCIILSERIQTQNVAYCIILFIQQWKAKLEGQKTAQWLPGTEGGWSRLNIKGQKKRNLEGVTELLCILIVVVDTALNMLVKIHVREFFDYTQNSEFYFM